MLSEADTRCPAVSLRDCRGATTRAVNVACRSTNWPLDSARASAKVGYSLGVPVAVVPQRHADAITIGNLTIEARHTPGHTPEHLSFLVTDGAFSDSPGYLLSGDFVFVGDLGRPDLLDEAAGGVDTRFAGAHQLYESLRDEFLTLPDYVQVHPAHGAGSACGRALGAIASTTVGYERENAWWAGFLRDRDEEGFVRALLDGQPDAHAYFARMKRQNKLGPVILGEMSELVEIDSETLSERLAADEVIFVDTRRNADVHQGTVVRSLNVPGVEKAASYGAWVYDPERGAPPARRPGGERGRWPVEFRDHVVRVGIDTVIGFTTSLAGLPQEVPPVITQDQLESTERALLLDVRNRTEYECRPHPRSRPAQRGRVLWRLDQLPASGTIVTYCQSGVRNSVASSALRREGYDVVELDGSYAGWLDPPSRQGDQSCLTSQSRKHSSASRTPSCWTSARSTRSRRAASPGACTSPWVSSGRASASSSVTDPSSPSVAAATAAARPREVLTLAGFSCQNMAGGMLAWQAAGLPTV